MVQPSGFMYTSWVPALTIGSRVRGIPALRGGGRPGYTEVRHLGVLVHLPADAMAYELADDREPGGLDMVLDRRRDVAEPAPGLGVGDPHVQGVLGALERPL